MRFKKGAVLAIGWGQISIIALTSVPRWKIEI